MKRKSKSVRPTTAQEAVNRRFSIELSRDPLASVTRPPTDESPTARKDRLVQEQDAKARSDAIDRDIEKIRRRGLGAGAAGIESLPTLAGVGKEAQVIQLLLLGNTEAGKSTFLRQMRMLYDRASLDREREAFRLAILLAIVTHSRFLLDLLEFSSPLPSPRSPLASPASSSSETNKSPVLLRRMRLAPLLALEDTLREHLGIVSVHAGASGATFAAHASAGRGVATTKRLGSSDGWRGTPPPSPSHPLAASGFYVRPDKWAALPTTTEDDETGNGRRAILARSRAPGKSDDPARLISGCSEEIANLWRDAVDQGLIAGEGVNVDGERGAVIAEGASYFLSAIERIARMGWTPTDQDVLHLRIETLGVEEHVVLVEPTLIYRVIDVAGAAGNRRKWASFFSHSSAVIFLAAISEYDDVQQESEGRYFTKMHETLGIFESVVGHPALKDCSMLVFLNKVDIFKRKLRSGRSPLERYFPRYHPKEGTEPEGRAFFKATFQQIHNKSPHTSLVRGIYIHSLQATDTRSTRLVLAAIQDILMRNSLVRSGML